MTTDLDFFELEEEAHPSSEQQIAENYLKELGVERYDFEQYTSGGPGKYYDDTPLDRNPEAYFDTLATQTLSGPAGFVDDSPYFYLDGDVSEYDIDAAFAVDGERPGTSRYEDEIHLTNPETVSTSTTLSGKRVSFRETAVVVQEVATACADDNCARAEERQQQAPKTKKAKGTGFFGKKSKDKSVKTKTQNNCSDERGITQPKFNVNTDSKHLCETKQNSTEANKGKSKTPSSPNGTGKLKLKFPSLDRKSKNKKSSPEKQSPPRDELKKEPVIDVAQLSYTKNSARDVNAKSETNRRTVTAESLSKTNDPLANVKSTNSSNYLKQRPDHGSHYANNNVMPNNIETADIFTDIVEYSSPFVEDVSGHLPVQTSTPKNNVESFDNISLYSTLYRPVSRSFHIPFSESDSKSNTVDHTIVDLHSVPINDDLVDNEISRRHPEQKNEFVTQPDLSTFKSRLVKDESFFDSLPETSVDVPDNDVVIQDRSEREGSIEVDDTIRSGMIDYESRSRYSDFYRNMIHDVDSSVVEEKAVHGDRIDADAVCHVDPLHTGHDNGVFSAGEISTPTSSVQYESHPGSADFNRVLEVIAQDDIRALDAELAKMCNEDTRTWRDEKGNNILHAAINLDSFECFTFLIAQYPQMLKQENGLRLNPVAEAVRLGRIEMFDWLLEQSDLSEEILQHGHKRNIIHHAAKYGQDGCLRILLSKLQSDGRDLNYYDSRGDTPAHLAAKYGQLTCLQTLAEFGVDVTLTNRAGNTPCSYADGNNQRQCVGYLLAVEASLTLAKQSTHLAQRMQSLKEENQSLMETVEELHSTHIQAGRAKAQTMDYFSCLQDDFDEYADAMSAQVEQLYQENCSLRQKRNGTMRNLAAEDEMRDSISKANTFRGNLRTAGTLLASMEDVVCQEAPNKKQNSALKKSDGPATQEPPIILSEMLRKRLDALRNEQMIPASNLSPRRKKSHKSTYLTESTDATLQSRRDREPSHGNNSKPPLAKKPTHIETLEPERHSPVYSTNHLAKASTDSHNVQQRELLHDHAAHDVSDTSSVPSIRTLPESDSTHGHVDDDVCYVVDDGEMAGIGEAMVLGVVEGDEEDENEEYVDDFLTMDFNENLEKDELLQQFLNQSPPHVRHSDAIDVIETVSKAQDIEGMNGTQLVLEPTHRYSDYQESSTSFISEPEVSENTLVDDLYHDKSNIPKKKPRPPDKPVIIPPLNANRDAGGRYREINQLPNCQNNRMTGLPETEVQTAPPIDEEICTELDGLDVGESDLRLLPSYRASPFESRLSTIEEMSVMSEDVTGHESLNESFTRLPQPTTVNKVTGSLPVSKSRDLKQERSKIQQPPKQERAWYEMSEEED